MASAPAAGPRLQFFRMIAQGRPPQRADRSACGSLPTRAFRYCEAITQASGYGWYIFLPMDFDLIWDGTTVFWSSADYPSWLPLDAVQFPHLAKRFDVTAPPALQGCSPPFLTALPEPGVVQVWTGLIARTAPEWSLHVRAPANLPGIGGLALYEGIVETDHWFGPLFTNVRLTRTDHVVRLRADVPLLQVQALPRALLAQDRLQGDPEITELEAFTDADWSAYHRTIVSPLAQTNRRPGAYATAARRGRCPMAASAG